jgi:D-threonate/D-erythronate kinase
MRAAIIADDLTGACDSAARAALAGWRPRVLLKDARSGLDIIVVSTASRGFTPERAAETVTEAARALLARAVRPVFKKIDSTLRGPWATEVAALQAITHAQVVAVCPAFPACNRVVRNGIVYSGDQKIGAIAPALEAAGIMHAAELICADAENESDMQAFVEDVAARGRTVLWVGSAGLARHAFGWRAVDPVPLPRAARWIIITASRHNASKAQVERAHAAGIPVFTPAQAESVPLGPDTGLFFIGGFGAHIAATRLGIHALDVTGEVVPGVAAGHVVGGAADGMPFASKSGAFGTADTVVDVIESLSR